MGLSMKVKKNEYNVQVGDFDEREFEFEGVVVWVGEQSKEGIVRKQMELGKGIKKRIW